MLIDTKRGPEAIDPGKVPDPDPPTWDVGSEKDPGQGLTGSFSGITKPNVFRRSFSAGSKDSYSTEPLVG